MIGVCGYYDYINGVRSGLDLNAVPGLKIGTRQGKYMEKNCGNRLAAGEGMGSGIPKQYMLIKSRPLVYYAEGFERAL